MKLKCITNKNDLPSLQILLFVYKLNNSKQRAKFEVLGGLSYLLHILELYRQLGVIVHSNY